jgi:UDP-N-acetylglucosamine 3-dehydrogenase
MSVLQSLNVGIVGLGWPGDRHAEALNASPLGIVHSACDQNAERLKAFVDSYRPKQSFASFDEMLLDSELDAVVIGLPI